MSFNPIKRCPLCLLQTLKKKNTNTKYFDLRVDFRVLKKIVVLVMECTPPRNLGYKT